MAHASVRGRWLASAGVVLLQLVFVTVFQQTCLAAVNRVDSLKTSQLLTSRPPYAYLDVRTPEEHKQGHVPGAINIPWSLMSPRGVMQLNPNFLQLVRARFPDSKQLLVVGCRSGSRSAAAAALLAEHYPNMVEHQGGFLDWVATKLPIATE